MKQFLAFLSIVYRDSGWKAVGVLIVILVLSAIALYQFLGVNLIDLVSQLGD